MLVVFAFAPVAVVIVVVYISVWQKCFVCTKKKPAPHVTPKHTFSSASKERTKALLAAAERGELATVKSAISRGAQINAVDDVGLNFCFLIGCICVGLWVACSLQQSHAYMHNALLYKLPFI